MRSAEPGDQLIAAVQAMHREGLVVGTASNASVRDGARVHVTPSALPYGSMASKQPVTLDIEGNVVDVCRVVERQAQIAWLLRGGGP